MEALRQYLVQKDEHTLHQAYELGRRTIAGGLGSLTWLKSMKMYCAPSSKVQYHTDSVRAAKVAGAFLTESLSPFEMTHRGFRDANQALSQLNETLEDRNRELAAANHKFKNTRSPNGNARKRN